MKKIFFLVIMISLATLAFAQQAKPAAGTSPLATSVCAYTQTSGSGATYFATCESVNGNLVQFTSPSGYEHIRVGSYGEGYGVCDLYAASGGVGYYDYADFGDSANWQAPITLTTSPLSIMRTTTDGVFTLTQTFSRNNPENILKIAMKLKNNYGIDYSTGRWVWLTRWVDFDVNNGVYNNFGNTTDSVFAWNEGWNGAMNTKYGLELYSTPTSTGHLSGFTPLSAGTHNPCTYPGNPTAVNIDGGAYIMQYFLLKPGTSKVVNVEYKRF